MWSTPMTLFVSIMSAAALVLINYDSPCNYLSVRSRGETANLPYRGASCWTPFNSDLLRIANDALRLSLQFKINLLGL